MKTIKINKMQLRQIIREAYDPQNIVLLDEIAVWATGLINELGEKGAALARAGTDPTAPYIEKHPQVQKAISEAMGALQDLVLAAKMENR
jgi:hypothetical protein